VAQYIYDEKQLTRIVKIIQEHSDLVQEIFEVFYQEELANVEEIEIYNVKRDYSKFNKEVIFTLGIRCIGDSKIINIQDCMLIYDPVTKDMYWNNLVGSYMDVEAREIEV
jgi:hypothetical protein